MIGVWLAAKGVSVSLRDGYEDTDEMIRITRRPVWFAHRDPEDQEGDKDVRIVKKAAPSKADAAKARAARDAYRKADAARAKEIRRIQGLGPQEAAKEIAATAAA